MGALLFVDESVTAGSVISSAATDLMGQAAPIITAAIGIGALFFGVKFLWGKFKGMAK